MPCSPSRSRRLRIDRLIPVLAALLAGGLLFFTTRREPAFEIPVLDEAEYHRQAVMGTPGRSRPALPFWQPPLYPAWLETIYAAAGPRPRIARAVQILFPAALVFILFRIGESVDGPRSAFWAALLAAVNGPIVFFNSRLLPATMAAVLLLAVLLLIINAGERLRRWFFAGWAAGLAALAVPNCLAVLPAVLLLPRVPGGIPKRKSRLSRAALLLAGVSIGIAPAVCHNYRVTGRFVPVSTNGGINLFLGNNPDRARTLAIRPGLDWKRLTTLPYRAGSRNPVEAQDFFLQKVFEYAADRPLDCLSGLLEKTRGFFSGIEIPRNLDPYYFRRHSRLLALLLWRTGGFGFPFGLLAPLGLLGMALTLNNPRARFLSGALLLYAFSIILFFPAARYRIPAVPLFILFAVLAIRKLAALRKKGTPLLPFAALAALLSLLTNLPVSAPASRVPFEAELQTAMGTFLEFWGYRRRALAFYRKALEIDPAFVEAHFELAGALRIKNRPEEAIRHYQAAIRLRPDHAPALAGLGRLFAQTGRFPQAVVYLERALLFEQDDPRVHVALGNAKSGLGDRAGAILAYRNALALQPGNAPARRRLAALQAAQAPSPDRGKRVSP